ncbi:Hypothetical protein NTJ_04810 [Nesidiocoris tenuis]|uniref:Uncharacterized protein n=1 Tax=Nesidiocoris tenuis TaxID=355587 RepID=A0ABN7ANN5_9HEMI|nr:Hypothetical protein NTJ_04810 [Nesidiocoris tenuis]
MFLKAELETLTILRIHLLYNGEDTRLSARSDLRWPHLGRGPPSRHPTLARRNSSARSTISVRRFQSPSARSPENNPSAEIFD